MCLTHQLLAVAYGGKAGEAKTPEFGIIEITVDDEDDILRGMGPKFKTIQSHNDEILELGPELAPLAHSEKCKYQVVRHKTKPIFGVQFHAETMQGEKDMQLFENFLRICREFRAKQPKKARTG